MIIFKGSLYAQLTVTDDKSQLYNNTQHPPFYGHYTGQPVLAGTSSKELENVAGAKFYRPHALLTATGAFGLGRRRWSSAQQFVIYTVSVLQSTKRHLPMCLFQTTTSLLCKATASRLEQWEAADATMGLDIGHTRSAVPASTSARSNHTAELRTPRVSD